MTDGYVASVQADFALLLLLLLSSVIKFTATLATWHVEMVRILYYSSPGEQKELESWKKSYVRGIEGVSCQHFQVMVTNLLQKLWEWQRGQKTNDEARLCDTTHKVLGEYGHQDGLRRGEKAHCMNF